MKSNGDIDKLDRSETTNEDGGMANDDPNKLSEIVSNKSIAETLPLGKEILFVGVICCAQFTTQAGLGQCLGILHVIGDDFGLTNPGELSWLIAAYSLTVGTFILMAGRFGDVYGYRRMLIIGFSWFSLWSMIAGLAVYSNHILFNFARVFQGIGPAICLPNGLAILGASYAPGPRKAMVFAIFGATAPGGAVVGSLFAALFSLAWWPWTFWSFSIALACIAIVGSFVIPDPPRRFIPRTLSLRERFAELDILGGVCGVTALVLINFAWNQSGVVGWIKPYVYVCLIIGFLFVPAFFYIELYISQSPLIPFKALTSDVAFVLGCVACGWSCFGIWAYYLWQFLSIARHRLDLSCRRLWSSCLCNHGISSWPPSTSVGDDDRAYGIHSWHNLDCYGSSWPDLLGTDIRLHSHYPVGYGYELPCSYPPAVQCSREGASGCGCQLGHYYCQLQHIAELGICWHNRKPCQSRWRDAR